VTNTREIGNGSLFKMSDDVWIGGGLLLTAGALGFLNYKNAMEKRGLVAKIAAAAQDTAHESGIPISYIVAQAVHESNYGRSGLATKSNNLFGIKAGNTWAGKFDLWPTWEVIDGKSIQVQAKFRKYDSWEDSVKDWYRLISGPRYAKVITAGRAHRASDFFTELQKAGYATDPAYSAKLIGTLNSIGAMV
jgi:flagellar protein FlgJ